MKKINLNKPAALIYPSHYTINNYKKMEILIVFMSILLLVGLAMGLNNIVLTIGITVSFVVTFHTLLKLSTIFRLSSKTAASLDKNYKPLVSILVACKSEPANIVIDTIKALTKLDYPKYEVLVINSNSVDKANWKKIQKFIKTCGQNFKFVHLDKIAGFKAGALNYLKVNLMNPNSKIEAIVDCDYIISPDFLKETVGYFKNDKIGIVQVPQDYYNKNKYNVGLFYEYRSFFRLVMHQSQRLDLVTFTGTMGLIRTDLLNKGLKWNEWCITEDVEAGTHINSIGYRGVYVDKSLGKGLMPFDYASLIKQRQRWSYGNMQIICKDLYHVITNAGLSIKQKIAFLAQLVTWFHFELIIASMYLGLNIIQFFGYSGNELLITNYLILFSLEISLIGNLIYFLFGLRKDTTIMNRFKAFLAHYGLLYVMSSSWLACLFGRRLGFNVTKKESTQNKTPFRQYAHEFMIIIILFIGLGLKATRSDIMNIDLIVVLTVIITELLGIIYLKRSLIKSNL